MIDGPKQRPKLGLWPAAFGLAAGILLGGLGGCAASGGAGLSWLHAGDRTALSPESRRELDRFNAVLRRESDGRTDVRAENHFADAFRRIQVSYVRQVGSAEMIDAAIRGVEEQRQTSPRPDSFRLAEAGLRTMAAGLDPHSAYLNAEEFRDSLVSTRSEFGGIGIEISAEDGLVKVVAPIEDTPASRAGIKAGDLVTHINGESIKDKGLMYAVNKMRGPSGSEIRLTILRTGTSFEARLTRATIKVRSVRMEIIDDVGYIRVTRFIEKVDESLEESVAEVQRKLGARLRGIVLDLRNNPGGLLEQSVEIADHFLDSGEIVTVKGQRGEGRRYEAARGDLARGIPMVVLINVGSASASEIVASALQHHKRAVIMGSQSFGKGSVQTVAPLPMEGALRLTTSLYYSPSGETIQARGVEPDIELIDSTEAAAMPGKEKDAKPPRRREADLPGAIQPRISAAAHGHGVVSDDRCRPAGEKKDRQIGCAIDLLHAGSPGKFLAAMGAKPAAM
ncbi:MAG: S41 family peptidase [Alphaproteobacteria bacterium]|nr:S41 family peptidase [Alphaproteobacteria bacterium]